MTRKVLAAGIMCFVLAFGIGVTRVEADDAYPPEMDEWLQAAKLGPYAESPQDWAAIEAAASIRPQDTAQILIDLTKSNDEDIVEAAYEAMAMAEAFFDFEDDDDGSRH